VYVTDLVRARTKEEFQRLCAEYVLHLTQILNDSGHDAKVLERLKKEFAKAGLVYETGKIVISKEKRWKSVSMYIRSQEGLPPTTNYLESIHGHLNEDTPRNNTFCGSLCHLRQQILVSISGFPTAARRNCNCATRK
jgi:hypothetical protein